MTEKVLKPTCDRKTKFWKGQKNTFGLLPGLKNGTCPGATTKPGGCWHIAKGRKLPECYVAHTMRCYSGVEKVLKHNTDLLANASGPEQVQILDAEFKRFREAERRHYKNKSAPLYYRLHWSGDIFNITYAVSLAKAIQLNSDIHFWCYTRSLFAIPILRSIPNLTLYISLDPVNVIQGLMVFTTFKKPHNNLQYCYMSKTDDFNDHMAEFTELLTKENELRDKLLYPLKKPRRDKRLRACPVDTGKLALEYGCSKCKQCVTSSAVPVWFKS